MGVKYCFRYNARNRAMRLSEDGEPITLENMPRPHRRRREKKLMTMDEVNEKFPMLKYKSWVAARAQEGLPTQGGVSVSPSRANSIRSVDGVVSELPSKERDSTDQPPVADAASKEIDEEKPEADSGPTEGTSAAAGDNVTASVGAQPSPDFVQRDSLPIVVPQTPEIHYDDDDDDEHINAALPPECMAVAGDTCAICIDTLEDDDDVRGLTCGHAFHAVCLDPWLTSRRACCPLCKADYYTPKPRAPGAEGADGTGAAATSVGDTARQRANASARPPAGWLAFRAVMFNRSNNAASSEQPSTTQGIGRRLGLTRDTRSSTSQASPATGASPATEAQNQNTSGGRWLSNLRSHLPLTHRRNGGISGQSETPAASGADAAVSPSELEAGVREGNSRS